MFHALGLGGFGTGDVMSQTLPAGVRRLPGAADQAVLHGRGAGTGSGVLSSKNVVPAKPLRWTAPLPMLKATAVSVLRAVDLRKRDALIADIARERLTARQSKL